MTINIPPLSELERPEAVQKLLRDLSALPAELRGVIALGVAAELTQYAAYEAMRVIKRGDVADLIDLSAELEAKAQALRLQVAVNDPVLPPTLGRSPAKKRD